MCVCASIIIYILMCFNIYRERERWIRITIDVYIHTILCIRSYLEKVIPAWSGLTVPTILLEIHCVGLILGPPAGITYKDVSNWEFI